MDLFWPTGTSASKIGWTREEIMLAAIAAVLVVLWLLGFLAFHVSSGLIHILLILAVISLIAHFFRGRAVA